MDTQCSGNGHIGGTLSSSLVVRGGSDLFLPRMSSNTLLYPTGVYRIPNEVGERLPASPGLETRLDRERPFTRAAPSQGDASHAHTTSVQ